MGTSTGANAGASGVGTGNGAGSRATQFRSGNPGRRRGRAGSKKGSRQLPRLLRDMRHEQEEMSVLDLKAQCRGAKYVEETIKLLPQTPEPILLERIFAKIVGIGRIHAPPANPIPT